MASEIGKRLKSMKIFRRRRHSEASSLSLASTVSHNGNVQLITSFNHSSSSPLGLESEQTNSTLLNQDQSGEEGGDEEEGRGDDDDDGKGGKTLVREEELHSLTRSSNDDGGGSSSSSSDSSDSNSNSNSIIIAKEAAVFETLEEAQAQTQTQTQTVQPTTTAAVAETLQKETQGLIQQPTARPQGSSTWNQRQQASAKPLGLTNDPSGNDLQRSSPSPPPSSSGPLSPTIPSTTTTAAITPTTPVVIIPGLCSIDEDQLSTQQPPSPSTSAISYLSSSSSSNSNSHADAFDDDAAHDSSQQHGNSPLQLSAAASLPTPTSIQSPSRRPVSPPPAPSSPSLRPAVQTPASASSSPRPKAVSRRQSLISNRHVSLIQSLLYATDNDATPRGTDFEDSVAAVAAAESTFSRSSSIPISDTNMAMSMRKIWVRRPHASPTLITIHDHDLVDDVRDMILKKYANSLGRTFDSPDLTIRICPRDGDKARILGPEEPIGDTLDSYFPEGQAVGEALVIDIPRRTPKASPRAPHPGSATAVYYNEDGRPPETGEGYFPPVTGIPSPHLPNNVTNAANGAMPHSISVINSGHLPPIPSPGGGTRSRQYRERQDRPRLGRTHTSSPNLHNGIPASMSSGAISSHNPQHHRPRHSHSRTHSSSSDITGIHAAATPMTKSPGQEMAPARMGTPSPRLSSPRVGSARPKKSKKSGEYSGGQPGMLNSSVPPISVLIVEDNPINLKLLEAFVKRLKVRWQTAMNGRDAVKKWRTGGFHLVLMDIQLPVMNGLEATREIRRLERLNNVGVFSSVTPSSVPEEVEELTEQDRLKDATLFKSPVIIVALTASSLQSDRHEALAAGCNDFLTKPVNFVWLERKVMEWGCMQALIDFDGWRKWKDYSEKAEELEANRRAQAQAAKSKSKKNRSSLSLS
ncbi:Response regulator mcs4 [Cladobotryum mycophilum]|uniref:Response regulator mcs4 n=1 Tax=Cladobotryum mycophilum TaxID=491253 RepID=A0ABR0T3N1_9HYPO